MSGDVGKMDEFDVYELLCARHPQSGCVVQFDRKLGALVVACSKCLEMLGYYRVRPQGCECPTPGQRGG